MTGLGNYLAQAYARMNLPQIRSFILTGEPEKTQQGQITKNDWTKQANQSMTESIGCTPRQEKQLNLPTNYQTPYQLSKKCTSR